MSVGLELCRGPILSSPSEAAVIQGVGCLHILRGRHPGGRVPLGPAVYVPGAAGVGRELLQPRLRDPNSPEVRGQSPEMIIQVVVLLCYSEIESRGSNFRMWTGGYDFNKV